MSDEGSAPQGEITRLLIDWRAGDQEAYNRLFTLLYRELRALARHQRRRAGPERTLDTTAVLHEAYLKLVDPAHASVQDRNHFLSLAARAMRHILVDHARGRAAQKRGSDARTTLDHDPPDLAAADAGEMVAIDAALTRLEDVDPRLGKVVELRFFGGLSVEETAAALDSSPRTVKRDWQKARAFLYNELSKK